MEHKQIAFRNADEEHKQTKFDESQLQTDDRKT